MSTTCTAFAGAKRIASGGRGQVALAVKDAVERGEGDPILVFDDMTSGLVEFDLRGGPADILARLSGAAAAAKQDDEPARGPGRPRLGVVPREVTLLPRHWDWLNSQPGGASVALRKLVESARKAGAGADGVRLAREAADRFMSAMAGNQPGYEEAARALYAGAGAGFERAIASWPADVREHARRLAATAFEGDVA
jgi:uncharacterized protein